MEKCQTERWSDRHIMGHTSSMGSHVKLLGDVFVNQWDIHH